MSISLTVKHEQGLSKRIWMSVLFLVALSVFFLDIALGPVKIPLEKVIHVILGMETDNYIHANIIENIRIPKAITAILCGCALSVAGLLMQTLFRNPMAGPDVLGITSGASLGVAMLMLASGVGINMIKQVSWFHSWMIVMAASFGSAMVLLIVLGISIKIRNNATLLIIGIMIGTLTISVVSLLLFFSSPEQVQDYLAWTFGSIGGVTKKHLYILSLFVSIGLFLALLASKSLNMLLLGENYAQAMGLSLTKSRIIIIAATSLLAGSITAFCGPIAFIGLAVPHLCRALFNTSDHALLIAASCLTGSTIMLICDIIVHSAVSQTVLPINVVTAFVGAPVVIWVILTKGNIKKVY